MANRKQQPKPALSISTTPAERRAITIDGQAYELKGPDEISIFERERLRLRGIRLEALMGHVDGQLSDAEIDEAQEILGTIARAFVVAPPEVHGRLTDGHRLAIAQVIAQSLPAPAGAR